LVQIFLSLQNLTYAFHAHLVSKMTERIKQVLEDNLYLSICTFSGHIMSVKKFSLFSLMSLRESMTTFHKFRFFNFMIKKLFPNSLCETTLLQQLYSKTKNRDQPIHMFYIIVLLCIIYFKNTDSKVNRKICKLIYFFQQVTLLKQPFHLQFVQFEKNKKHMISINNTKLPVHLFLFTNSSDHILPEFAKLRKMICQASKSEWLPNKKHFLTVKGVCNFIYKYYTSNRILQYTDVKTMKKELFYPKQYMDFAYHFKRMTIEIPSFRRKCFDAIKRIVISPQKIKNLSVSHYYLDFLSFFVNSINNKVIMLMKPSCFCHTKCIRKKGTLEKLYQAGFFILCKTCSCPVNYHHKIFNKVYVINDFNNPTRYFSCADGCSQFHMTDLYKCNINENGVIHYHHKALLSVRGKKKYVTTICLASRTCTNIITSLVSSGTNFVCKSCSKEAETCIDFIKHCLSENHILVDRAFILNNMCDGCLTYCFDFCSRYNKYNIRIRQILYGNMQDK